MQCLVINCLVLYLDKNVSSTTFAHGGVSMGIHYPDGLPIERSEVQNLHSPSSCYKVAIVHITVTQRALASQIPANPNRDHLPELVENIVQLGIRDGSIEIADVKRRHELVHSTTGVPGLRLNLNLCHPSSKP
nr:hypothetical protein VPNG_09340 [Ipomoea batatas]GME07646.1 hypothetical protein VPNG_09340 [Ipomoea batatas]GME20488.1 hypothetical protein VPNG_09340 [Ipomoea batatas]